MDKICDLSAYIEDEIEDAHKYADAAVRYKEEDPGLAQLFYDLSMAETDHMQKLHNWAVKAIQEAQGKFH